MNLSLFEDNGLRSVSYTKPFLVLFPVFSRKSPLSGSHGDIFLCYFVLFSFVCFSLIIFHSNTTYFWAKFAKSLITKTKTLTIRFVGCQKPSHKLTGAIFYPPEMKSQVVK